MPRSNLSETVAAFQALHRVVARRVLARAERRAGLPTLAERLTTAQHLGLAALADGPLGTSEFAAVTDVATSTATRMIQGLRELGLVEPVAAVVPDGRRRWFGLTPAGHATLRDADRALAARLSALLTTIDQDDRAVLLTAVAILREAIARRDAALADEAPAAGAPPRGRTSRPA